MEKRKTGRPSGRSSLGAGQSDLAPSPSRSSTGSELDTSPRFRGGEKPKLDEPRWAATDMWMYSAAGPRLFNAGEEIPDGYEDSPAKARE